MQQGVFKRSHPIWIMESSSWDLPSLSRIRVVAVEVVIVVVSSGSSSSDGSGSFRSHSFSNLQQIKISIETKITSWGYNGSPTWLSNSVFFFGLYYCTSRRVPCWHGNVRSLHTNSWILKTPISQCHDPYNSQKPSISFQYNSWMDSMGHLFPNSQSFWSLFELLSASANQASCVHVGPFFSQPFCLYHVQRPLPINVWNNPIFLYVLRGNFLIHSN